jgi:hypothetical protein
MKAMTVDITQLRDNIGNFDDFLPPPAQLLLPYESEFRTGFHAIDGSYRRSDVNSRPSH